MKMDKHAMVSFRLCPPFKNNVKFLYPDIDECLNDPCDTNATCLNANGSFICTCNDHFSGNGLDCTKLCENGYQLNESDMICGTFTLSPIL